MRMGSKRQAGVLPFRWHNGQLEVLLVTSRTVGRWVIPKGNVGKKTAQEAASKEAFEEAGLRGRIDPEPLGCYLHGRPGDQRWVDVYLMEVTEELPEWPEQAERQRQWMPLAKAQQQVYEDGLRALLARLPAELERRTSGRALGPVASRALVIGLLLLALALAFGGTYYLARLLQKPEVRQRLKQLEQQDPTSSLQYLQRFPQLT
ncbi:NUDIX hydrolase [Rhodothermus bifroesti]|nr:hypothetical protein HRbin18_00542 [bacterium HR18]